MSNDDPYDHRLFDRMIASRASEFRCSMWVQPYSSAFFVTAADIGKEKPVSNFPSNQTLDTMLADWKRNRTTGDGSTTVSTHALERLIAQAKLSNDDRVPRADYQNACRQRDENARELVQVRRERDHARMERDEARSRADGWAARVELERATATLRQTQADLAAVARERDALQAKVDAFKAASRALVGG